jgi:hypothetical protein
MDDSLTTWSVEEARLRDLTPHAARDLLVECFLAAQGEVYRRTALSLGMVADTGSTRAQVEASVKLKFRELGHDYENPTASCIRQVMDRLAVQAGAWGTPPEIIDHHLAEMNRVLDRL